MKIGFMQGRLCDCVDGKIQAFPMSEWETEFPQAEKLGLTLMEWTLDYDNLYQNPLLSNSGRKKILQLCKAHSISIQSLTGDCFMQRPFYYAESVERDRLLYDLASIIEAARQIDIQYIVFPLVDYGSLTSVKAENLLINGLLPFSNVLTSAGMKILFESDYSPCDLMNLMKKFPADAFGINYDIGNSAAMGYDPVNEITLYGKLINNVHVKDRVLNGATVPLGSGNADFPKVFSLLNKVPYCGNYILQTARADDGDHSGVIFRYSKMIRKWHIENES
jgi:L-ribulose-5-phosphate 3-epimerase